MLSFIRYVLQQGWRYGARAVRAAADWARANWPRVRTWLQGASAAEVLRMILEILGYL
ncbi:aureocin A53 family class IId bacteriocin [Nesterenkonia sp. PF2B19]|uniref:aureocin A53 family class IId bacteriocin n=1 Tax=unclassified Nesterenkonia TaxID=2629769 RepID=UPI001481FD38|nr:aureocin A53 family class IId bacteriocin [Nesterenkonia sp. PF2B19]